MSPYIYCVVNNSRDVIIKPKHDLYYDQHLSRILNLGNDFHEVNECCFEYTGSIPIEKRMIELGIDYSEELNKLVNNSL